MNTYHIHDHGSKNLKWAFVLNFLFTIIEFIGGLFTNSLSIMSDALHDLGDSLSLGLAWYFEKLSKKGRDKKFSYGYKRFSLLAAILNSLILIIGAIFILQAAIPRLINPETAHVGGMIVLAVVGMIFNGLAVFKLKSGHSHNERMVYLHLMEDVLGWVAVLIGSVVIYFTGWMIIDPILSLGITLFIVYNVYKNLKSSIKIVLQGIPEDIDLEKLKDRIRSLDGVVSFHDLHIWSLDGKRNILTVHLVTQGENPYNFYQSLKNELKIEMRKEGINHCTVEFEKVSEECELVNC